MDRSDGSVLLIVLIITSFLSSLLLGSWQHASITYDIVTEREQAYHKFLITNLLLDHIIGWAKKKFDMLLDFDENKKTSKQKLYKISSRCNELLNDICKQVSLNKKLTAHIQIEPYPYENNQSLFMRVDLLDTTTTLQTIRSVLIRTKNKRTDEEKQPSIYNLKYYTLGTPL